MDAPVVILVGTSHPGNIGAVARAGANFGVEELRFVAPRSDIHSKEAMDRARHASEMLLDAEVFDSLEEALVGISLGVGTTARTNLADNRFLRKPQDVRQWAGSLVEAGWDGRVALVFGPEDAGLTAHDVNRLDQLVTVPTADYASLNLSHAVSLLCWEHMRVREAVRETERSLGPDTLRALHHAFDCIAEEVEPREWRREVAGGMWRKIMGRSLPSDHEVHNIMGILANTLKRFDHPEFRTKQSSKVLGERGLLVQDEE